MNPKSSESEIDLIYLIARTQALKICFASYIDNSMNEITKSIYANIELYKLTGNVPSLNISSK